MSIENCIEFFVNADKYHLKALRSKALTFVCGHFEVLPIEEIEQMDSKYFQEVLECDLIVSAETIVFDRLVQWMDHNKIESGEVATDMINLIRLAHIPSTVSCRIYFYFKIKKNG